MSDIFIALLVCSAILLVSMLIMLKISINECFELSLKIDKLREKLQEKNNLLEKRGVEIKKLRTEIKKPKKIK
jgi:hypothetical protein